MTTITKHYGNTRFNPFKSSFKGEYWGFAMGLIFLLLYFLPYSVLGEDAFFTILDNLDSNVSWFVILKNSGLTFSFDNHVYMEQIMGGSIPRNAMPPAFNLVTLLFFFFNEPFHAYIFNFFLSHLLAYIGMFLLLKTYVFRHKRQFLSALIALTFALLPFYDIYGGGSVSGLPLCGYAFVNLYIGRKRIISFVLLFSLGFYTSLVLSSFFVCLLVLIALLFFLVRHRRFNLNLFLGLVIFSLANVIAEINLFILTFLPTDFISHRNEFNPLLTSTSLKGVLINFKNFFFEGQFHSPSFHFNILLLSFLYIPFLLITKQPKHKAIFLFITLLAFNFVGALRQWDKLNQVKEAIAPLKFFNFSRVMFLSSTLWYLLFAYIIRDLLKIRRYGFAIAYVLIAFQIYTIIRQNSEFLSTAKLFVTGEQPEVIVKGSKKYPLVSFRQFFAEDVFDKVKGKIKNGNNTFYVASVGLYPSVAQYNGFRTLDSYQPNYDLRYKHSFRDLIAEELEESPKLKRYFDEWGSRCYIFSSELVNDGYYILEQPGIEDLDLNTQKFKEMGGKYILSAVPLNNSEDIGLRPLGKVESEVSPLVVFLYEVY